MTIAASVADIITLNTLKIHYPENINYRWLEAKVSRPKPRFFVLQLSSRLSTVLEELIPG